jgi:hypothetical protein
VLFLSFRVVTKFNSFTSGVGTSPTRSNIAKSEGKDKPFFRRKRSRPKHQTQDGFSYLEL